MRTNHSCTADVNRSSLSGFFAANQTDLVREIASYFHYDFKQLPQNFSMNHANRAVVQVPVFCLIVGSIAFLHWLYLPASVPSSPPQELPSLVVKDLSPPEIDHNLINSGSPLEDANVHGARSDTGGDPSMIGNPSRTPIGRRSTLSPPPL